MIFFARTQICIPTDASGDDEAEDDDVVMVVLMSSIETVMTREHERI